MAKNTFSRMSVWKRKRVKVSTSESDYRVLKISGLTVAGNKKYNKIEAGHNPDGLDPAIGKDTEVHDFVPILPRQNLCGA